MRMLQRVGRISVCVVVGLLFIAGIWRLVGSRLEKKSIADSGNVIVNTVQAAAPSAEDGSGDAGIAELKSVKPVNQVPGWQYDGNGWWYAPSANTYYANGWMEIEGKNYHFASSGYMDTGWKAIAGTGYYFEENGVYNPDADSSKMIAMTFDDGPSSYTSRLLDILEANGAKATFFMQGCNVEDYGAEVIPRMAALGCDIGNHSYNHPNMHELSLEEVADQFGRTDDLIAQYNHGEGASVIRFPYGNDGEELQQVAARPCFLWDVDTLDWKTKNVQSNISAVLDNVSQGEIVLMHDIYSTTVEACETIIPELINRGYQLVTVRTLAAARGVELQDGGSYFGFTDTDLARLNGEGAE